MRSKISAKRISGGTTFKILLVGFLTFHIVSTLIAIALVVIGVLPLEATNPELTTPLLFLVAYLIIGVLFCPVWVGFLWLSIWPGIWLYSLFRPMDLGYVPPDAQKGA